VADENNNALLTRLDTITSLLKQLVSKDAIQPRLFSIKQAEVYTGHCAKKLRKEIRKGNLRKVANGARWLIDKKSLDMWIERQL
jgi:hypothetical protein